MHRRRVGGCSWTMLDESLVASSASATFEMIKGHSSTAAPEGTPVRGDTARRSRSSKHQLRVRPHRLDGRRPWRKYRRAVRLVAPPRRLTFWARRGSAQAMASANELTSFKPRASRWTQLAHPSSSRRRDGEEEPAAVASPALSSVLTGGREAPKAPPICYTALPTRESYASGFAVFF